MSKKPKKQDTEKVAFTYGMIEAFERNQSLPKLKSNVQNILKLKIFRLINSVMNSDGAKAYFDLRKEIVETYEKEQTELPEKDRQSLTLADPRFQEIFEQDAGLEVQKISVRAQDLPDNFDVDDMFQLQWLIDFEE